MANPGGTSGQVISTGLGCMRAKLKYCTNFDPLNSRVSGNMVGMGNSQETGIPSCFCVRFSPCDRFLAVSYSNGAIVVYSTDNGDVENLLTSTQNATQSAVAMQLRWRPNSQTLMCGIANADFDGQVVHWNAQSGKHISSLTERENQVLCVDYFPDGNRFATAGYDRKIRIYDEKTRETVQTLYRGDGHMTIGHSNHIFSIKCHPQNSSILFSGGWDNTVQMWDTRQNKSFRSLSDVFICGDTLDFDSSTECLLTGSCRTTDALQLWDFGSGKLVESVQTHTETSDSKSMLFSAQFSKDSGSVMIAAGGHQVNEAKLYVREADGTKLFGALLGVDKPVFSLDFAQNSSMVAAGVADGGVRVVELSRAQY